MTYRTVVIWKGRRGSSVTSKVSKEAISLSSFERSDQQGVHHNQTCIIVVSIVISIKYRWPVALHHHKSGHPISFQSSCSSLNECSL